MAKEYKTIGEVVKLLQDKYPGLSLSKVRYLEDEGLLNPSRSASGYRKYSEEDFNRLEKILYYQKQYFYPLSVIKEKLDEEPPNQQAVIDESDLDKISLPDEILNKKHPIENIPYLINVEIGFLRKLNEFGLIKFETSPKGRVLIDGRELELVLYCYELKRFGIEPRHLKLYQTYAHRESVMFEQALNNVVTKLSSEIDDEERAKFYTTYKTLEHLTANIRSALIKKDLREEFKHLNL